LLYHSI
jgi:RNA polymerase sigma factor (sigma-70 family)